MPRPTLIEPSSPNFMVAPAWAPLAQASSARPQAPDSRPVRWRSRKDAATPPSIGEVIVIPRFFLDQDLRNAPPFLVRQVYPRLGGARAVANTSNGVDARSGRVG